ncbi:MAG TPA: class I SAM-dependent methyltransferase [Dehalococcoidia bacterium]|nr:class I SAM-dependent methyltransferase [Dehalococcoidia bacterium]
MNEYTRANLAHWDELARIHPGTERYGLAAFKAGASKLNALDRAEVGDVRGKTLLHLQCHFGLDTLSWAREDATVTGADFSGEAIAAARAIAAECGLPAHFVHSTIDELPASLDGQFDIVYTGRGALCWLPDIRRWAAAAAHFLRPGGVLYVQDTHPYLFMYDERPGDTEPRLLYSYFHSEKPDRFEAPASYADPNAKLEHTTEYIWSHPLGEMIDALIGNGLQIQFLHEFPYTYHNFFTFM